MTSSSNIYSLENPLFKSLAFHMALLIFKMMFVTLTTSFYRITKKVFANPEDARTVDPSGKLKPILNDVDVERARRALLNDMENIFPFMFISLIFIAMQPVPATCILCFRIFTIGRFLHTFFYLMKTPQPTRGLAFAVPLGVNLFMAYHIAKTTYGSF